MLAADNSLRKLIARGHLTSEQSATVSRGGNLASLAKKMTIATRTARKDLPSASRLTTASISPAAVESRAMASVSAGSPGGNQARVRAGFQVGGLALDRVAAR